MYLLFDNCDICTCRLVTKMAHGSLREFDPKNESVEDFHEHFEFYCVANGIQDDNYMYSVYACMAGVSSLRHQ